MLVLDTLIRPAFVLILHYTADELVILLQKPLDRLLIDFRLAFQPVRYEGHRHPGKPGWTWASNPAPGPPVTWAGSVRWAEVAEAAADGTAARRRGGATGGRRLPEAAVRAR